MKRVIVETPYSAPTKEGIESNIQFLKNCLMDCLIRGESPYASHLFFTQFLDDNTHKERSMGMNAGQAWYAGAEKVVVYLDRSLSKGMEAGITKGIEQNLPIELRRLWDRNYSVYINCDMDCYGHDFLKHLHAYLGYSVELK